MKPGTKPTPTALRKLRGNPGKRPLPKGEPKPKRVSAPRCPTGMSKGAQVHWRREGARLAGAGLLTEADLLAFRRMCEDLSVADEAMAMVEQYGMVIKTTNGNLIQSPYLGIANRLYDRALRIMTEFGMTPSARTRIQVPEQTDEPTLAEALAGIVTSTEVYEGAQEAHANIRLTA